MILMPTNKQGDYYPIGDDVRLWAPVSQRSVIVERRFDDGWFGTGVGAKWERVPVNAEWASGPDGRRVIAIDPEGLRRSLGSNALGAALPGGSIILARPSQGGSDDDDEWGNNDRDWANNGRKRHRERSPNQVSSSGGGSGLPPSDNDDPSRKEQDPERRKVTLDISLQSGDIVDPSTEKSDKQPERKRPHELSDEEIQKIAEKIANHAYEKHKVSQREFLTVYNRLELFPIVFEIIKKHADWKDLLRERVAYWDDESGTCIIYNPHEGDQGTVHQPRDGKRYFKELDDPKKRKR